MSETSRKGLPMTVTLSAPRPSTGSLRELAEQIDELPGYRVEIIEGALVVSPTPSKRHNGIVKRIMLALDHQLPAGKESHPISSVEPEGGGEEYCSPDLVVVPSDEDYEDGWLYSSDIVDFALEVVSVSHPTNDTHIKPLLYAEWGIPIFLLVDPRDGSIVLYSDPVDGVYQAVHRMRFGDTVALPEPLKGIELETTDFVRYPAG